MEEQATTEFILTTAEEPYQPETANNGAKANIKTGDLAFVLMFVFLVVLLISVIFVYIKTRKNKMKEKNLRKKLILENL